MSYHVIFNDIDNRWKVVDDSGFPFGDGETKEEAIMSAESIGVIV